MKYLSTSGFITPSIASCVDLWFHNVHYCFMDYDQVYNAIFHQKLEPIQYNACFAQAGAIRGFSKKKLYEELSFGVPPAPSLVEKAILFYKFYKNEFLHNSKLIPLPFEKR